MGNNEDLTKSIPIHCVIEKTLTKVSRDEQQPQVDVDSYAIVPHNTPFADIVRTALIKIGYTSVEASGAKGTINIRNWKPLSFDMITDSGEATVEDILGEITSIATLRIQLSCRSRPSQVDEVKEKLLRLLVQHPHFSLVSSRCPIEKDQLTQICNGDALGVLSDDTYAAFNTWYSDQVHASQSDSRISAIEHDSSIKLHLATTMKGSVGPAKFWSPLPALSPLAASGLADLDVATGISRPRTKTIFDPELELPRLQRWFAFNARPSRQQMTTYMNELNSLSHRQDGFGRPRLELASICCWFKNARAALRRLQPDEPISAPTNCTPQSDAKTSSMNHMSNGDACITNEIEYDVPELPNSNAVYVINPHCNCSLKDKNVEVVTPADDTNVNNDDQPQDLSQSAVTEKLRDWLSPKPVTRCQQWSDADDDESLESDTENKLMSTSVNDQLEKTSANVSALTQEQRSKANVIQFCHQQLQHNQQRTTMQLAAMSYSLNLRQYMQSAAIGVYPSPGVVSSLPATRNANNVSYKEFDKAYKESDKASTSSSLDGGSGNEKKKRTRVFIDPLTEIPRLELWFVEDTHPSSYMIEKFTEELNNSPYRLRFPKLEAKNVQLWFKNHRAKVKRQKLDLSPSGAVDGRGSDQQNDWTTIHSEDSMSPGS